MIDIHCHALYGVDDGADDLDESRAMIRHAKSQGIDGIIFTPHYRHGMFAYPKKKAYFSANSHGGLTSCVRA